MAKEVGILTWHYYENVGSNLQAYALMKTIESMGYNVKFINYQQKKLHDSFGKKILKIIFSNFDNVFPGILPNKYTFKSFDFQRKFFKTTSVILDEKKLKKINNKIDIFVCGSDQIWSPLVFDKNYFLDFVDGKYKFSYAPSIGSNYIPDTLKKDYISLLNKFNGISIREKKGKELLANLNINAKVVLDPTFLLKKEDWMIIAKPRIEKKDYIFCYFLGENESYRKKVRDYSKKIGKKLIIYSSFSMDNEYCDERINKIGPREFLSYIYYADEIFTDSFHGVVFSLKFEKKFNSFYRFKENDKNNQNSRIINILDVLNLKNKLIGDNQDLNLQQIEYKEVNDRLNNLIDESLKYLNEELQNGSKYC